ncbi:unknown [Prevotella sp. CAG:1124]|nr:unknown [Prevotella sp. CAG:1124]
MLYLFKIYKANGFNFSNFYIFYNSHIKSCPTSI